MTELTIKKGKVYVIEGPDGVGKSTISELVAKKVGGVLMRDPSPDLPLARQIRHWLKTESICRETQIALVTAARFELIKEIQKHYLNGETIILDRFWPSTLAYQSFNCSTKTYEFILETIKQIGVPVSRIFILHDDFDVLRSRIGVDRDVMETDAMQRHVYAKYKHMLSFTTLMGTPVMGVHSSDITNAVDTIVSGM